MLQITWVVMALGFKLRLQSPCFLSWSTCLPALASPISVRPNLSSSSSVKILLSFWDCRDSLPAFVARITVWIEPGLSVASMVSSLIFLLTPGYPAHGRSSEKCSGLYGPQSPGILQPCEETYPVLGQQRPCCTLSHPRPHFPVSHLQFRRLLSFLRGFFLIQIRN